MGVDDELLAELFEETEIADQLTEQVDCRCATSAISGQCGGSRPN